MAKSKDEVRETFEHFDRDQNGTIDAAEFAQLLEALGGGFSPAEAKAGLAVVDANKNGRIEFAEFYRWWSEL